MTTGYLRSDNGNGSGGKIDLEATGLIKVTGAFSLNGKDYSIYTGTGKKGWVNIVYENGSVKFNKLKVAFKVGDPTSANGTAAQIEPKGTVTFKPGPIPLDPDSAVIIIIYEGIKRILDAGSAGSPKHVDEINPITDQPYNPNNPKEYDLVKELSRPQINRLRQLIYNQANPDRITADEVFNKGEVEPGRKCFNLELDRHLGNYDNHDIYATEVTGAPGDYLIISRNPEASYAFYDGEVKANGAAVQYNEPPGRLAEVKTGGTAWSKILNDQIDQMSKSQWRDAIQTLRELNYQIKVALFCQRQSFISFSVAQSAHNAQQVFAQKGKLPGVVHFIERLNARRSVLPPGLANDVTTAEQMLQPFSVLNVLVFTWKAVHNIVIF